MRWEYGLQAAEQGDECMTVAELLVRCLENEKLEYMFGVPGEENLAVLEAILDSKIHFLQTRHEQGAAFMPDVQGRLTGKASVCLATLGPGATNLLTGVADANMDRAPLVAITGQDVAEAEAPPGLEPLLPQQPFPTEPSEQQIERAAKIISEVRNPIVLAGSLACSTPCYAVALAESFGCRGYKVTAAQELQPILEEAFRQRVPAVVACPVDYGENLRLTEKLGAWVCP
jgi:thiamine pyrophosphate-dependent acetolactate synthase large subunit-like protein